MIIDRSDVYICSTASDFFGYIVILGKLIRGKKVIFRVAHDWDVNGHFTKSKSLIGFFHRIALPRADVIITQNKDQQTILKKTEDLSSIVIRNGFPINAGCRVKNGEFFLWIARSDAFKRPRLYLQLAKEMPDQRFVMILSGRSPIKDIVMSEAQSIENLDIVDDLGFFDSMEYFEKARCLINTSSSEGFPNTFIQAGLSRTPILSFSVNPEGILDIYGMGYCCYDDLEKARCFLNGLTEDRIKLLGDAAFDYVRLYHNLEDKIREYAEIVTTICQK